VTHRWLFQTCGTGIFSAIEFDWCFHCGALRVLYVPRKAVKVGRTMTYPLDESAREVSYRVPGNKRYLKREPPCRRP